MNPILIVIIILLSLIIFVGLILLVIELILNKMFKVRMDGDFRYNFLSIRDYPNLIKKDVSISSSIKDKKLNGGIFYYKANNYKGTIIFFHGLYSGYINYLNLIEYFCKKNFIVVSFDAYGTMSSEGNSIKGMSQVDLDNKKVIDFVINNKELNKYPIFTLGHSMGAHAAITSLLHDDIHIKKAVGLSPYNSNIDINYSFNPYLILLTPFFYLLNLIKFGYQSSYKVTDAIKYSCGDILILHGSIDPVIKMKYSYTKYFHAKHNNDIKNTTLRLLKDRKHFLYLSKRGEEYFTKNISWPRKDPIDFKNLDYNLVNELDYEILDEIVSYLLK